MAWGGPVWGIFDQDGNTVLAADSVASVEYQDPWRISDYPQEQGAFESYNKVKSPFTVKIAFLISGDISNRSDFLETLQRAVESLDLFVVVTPEISYDSANLSFSTYRRTARSGPQLIRVEVWLEEIRVVPTETLSNTKSTNGAVTQNNGSVSPNATGPNDSPNLVSNLTNPSGSGSTTITSPNIGPAFYNANNLPQVPSTYNLLNGDQKQSILSTGFTHETATINAFPPSGGRSYLIMGTP